MEGSGSKTDGFLKAACNRLASIEVLSPRELYDRLDDMGYVGQEDARRSLCLMAYRHVRRLKDIFLEKVPADMAPPKSTVLMIGPTGTGKTHMVELLFERIMKIPVVSVDMTCFTETGYMGRSVGEFTSELLDKAKGNRVWAMMGICIMDEFDKLAGASSNARFAGQGTTKDVSGFGVQRELLKMIEGGAYPATRDGLSPSGTYGAPLHTRHVGFVACGAFSGIKEIAVRERGGTFGFTPGCKPDDTGGVAYQLDDQDVASVEVFQRYGFLPELIGRFNSIVRFSPLGAGELREILTRNVLPGFGQEFRREGLELSVPQDVMDSIVDNAVMRKTGARGLSLQVTQFVENMAFERFGENRRDNVECVA